VNEEDSLISVVTTEHVASTSSISNQNGRYVVQVQLTEAGTERFSRRIVENTDSEEIREHAIFVRVKGESVTRFLISREFLNSMQSGDFQGTFQVQSESREQLEPLAREI
jgi:hypothetical protein